MKAIRSIPLLVLAGLLLSLAARAGSQAVPVIDPAALAAMGFPADATDVWRLLPDHPADMAAPVRPLGGHEDDAASYSVTGDDFRMASSSVGYDTTGQGTLQCTAGAAPSLASAVVHVPSGHRLMFLDLWGYDASPKDITAFLLATCMDESHTGNPSQTVLAQVRSQAAGGPSPGRFFDRSTIPSYYANPARCGYSINLALGGGACEGSALSLYKARVVWQED